MKFKCFSYDENMPKCKNQCEFCSKEYSWAMPKEVLSDPRIKDLKDSLRGVNRVDRTASRHPDFVKPITKSLHCSIPEDVYDKLMDLSIADNRSLTNTVQTILTVFFKDVKTNNHDNTRT